MTELCDTVVMTFTKSDNDKVTTEALRQLTASTAELSAAYDDLTTRYQAQTLEMLDLKSPSGKAVPTDVPAGWKTVFSDDFAVPCVEGQFEATYVPRGFGFYKDGWLDTSKHGTYSSKYISVQNSVCSIRLLGPTATTPAQVASIYPQMRGLTSVIFEERLRYTLTPGFKVAHLMWPDSGLKYPDGEMDWPESASINPPSGFVHYKGGVVNNDQAVFKTTADPRQWHTYRREWEAGLYVRYILDGVLVGEVTGAKVPSVPFHLSLQNETALGGVIPTSADRGLIETDWMRMLIRA